MLQNVKISRPDRLLQKRLIGLAYSLVALTAALILSIVFPQHLILLLGLTATITVFALALSLLTLKAGEKAISYGGFANEIIRLSSQAKRIYNSLGRGLKTTGPKNCSEKAAFWPFCKAACLPTTVTIRWPFSG